MAVPRLARPASTRRKLPQRLWLEHYAAVLRHGREQQRLLPAARARTFVAWRERTPPDFRWAVKASRFLTHIKRLREPEEPVARLMERAAGLGDRLDAILLQLPPTLKADADLLRECLAQFPAGTRVAVEPRHESWWTDEIRALLERYGAALCWADREEQPIAPLWRTTDWGYLRFHTGLENWRYRPETLQLWADRLAATWTAGRGRPRLLQQRPRGRGDDRRRPLRRRGPPGRGDADPRAHGRPGDRRGLGPGAADAGARRRPRRRTAGSSACRTPSWSAASPSTSWTARVSASGITALSVRPARRHSVTSISSCA